jgi:hypothetical protein
MHFSLDRDGEMMYIMGKVREGVAVLGAPIA